MTRDKGPTSNQSGASRAKQEERDREFDGHAAAKGETPSPGDRDRGETSSADDCAAIDLDTARDRAS